MKEKDIDVFEKLQSQLEVLYDEITELSKKAPNGSINKFKLNFTNDLLVKSNLLLTNVYRPFNKFSTFEEDDLPSNSDVSFIISQYLSCFERFRCDNIGYSSGSWYWVANKKITNRKTQQPIKFQR